MYTKLKRYIWCFLIVLLIFVCSACGSKQAGNTKYEQETETKKEIEIIDAKDILTTVWGEYESTDTDGNLYNDQFDVMGGHFTASVIGQPEKYDLTKINDLTQMYCIPKDSVVEMDDVATMIDLYNASRFTVSSIHVLDKQNLDAIVSAIHSQVLLNQWHSDRPEKLAIIKVKEHYVVSIYGKKELVNEFKEMLINKYSTVVDVVVEEKLPLE